MASDALRSLWAEPRPTDAPDRGLRDWALVAVLVGWSVVEVVLRSDLAPLPLPIIALLAVLGPLPWRRAHPLVVVAVSFGTWTVVDIVRILTGSEGRLLNSLSAALIVAYALPVGLRSGSRQRTRGHPALAGRHQRRRPGQPVGGGRRVRVLPVRRRARRRDPLSRENPRSRRRPGQGQRTRAARS